MSSPPNSPRLESLLGPDAFSTPAQRQPDLCVDCGAEVGVEMWGGDRCNACDEKFHARYGTRDIGYWQSLEAHVIAVARHQSVTAPKCGVCSEHVAVTVLGSCAGCLPAAKRVEVRELERRAAIERASKAATAAVRRLRSGSPAKSHPGPGDRSQATRGNEATRAGKALRAA